MPGHLDVFRAQPRAVVGVVKLPLSSPCTCVAATGGQTGVGKGGGEKDGGDGREGGGDGGEAAEAGNGTAQHFAFLT